MYLAVVGAIVGQALLLGQLELLIYAGVIWLIFVAFVHWYEEPTLPAVRRGVRRGSSSATTTTTGIADDRLPVHH